MADPDISRFKGGKGGHNSKILKKKKVEYKEAAAGRLLSHDINVLNT